MPPKSSQAPETLVVSEHKNRHRARKRRKKNHEQESIYLAPEPEPYGLSIKPSQGPSTTESEAITEDINNLENGHDIQNESPSGQKEEQRNDTGKGKGKGKGVFNKDDSYRRRAMKAWETKRNRQKERFEALESTSSLLGPGWASSVPMDLSTGFTQSESGISSSAVDPLLGYTNLRDLPHDLPKDDMLQSLQHHSSRYYTANNLLLEPHRRIRRKAGDDQESSSQLANAPATILANSPAHPHLAIPDEDSGSEYGSKHPTNEKGNDENNVNDDEEEDGELEQEQEVASTLGPRRRGGQRGKRKLKDMHLALDGSALLTLGILIQEQIISRLRQEGYVPASSFEEEEDLNEDAELEEQSFAVSDDEEEEGSDDDDDEE